MRSKRPNAPPKRSSPATISSSDAPSDARERRGRERVVDVVETGQAQADAPLARPACRARTRPTRARRSSICARDDVERRSRVPAGGAAVVAEMARRRRPRSRTASRSGRSTSSRRRAGGRPRAWRGSSRPNTTDPRAARARGRRPAGRRRSRRASSPVELACQRRASARRRARARRSGRAGRGRGCPGRSPAGWTPRAISGSAASSTSKSPSSAPCAASSVDATPETRLAPELLCASRTRRPQDLGHHRRRRRLAVRRRDERRCRPRSRAASRSIAPGSSSAQELARQRRAAARAREPREAPGTARESDFEAEWGTEAHAASVATEPAANRARPNP